MAMAGNVSCALLSSLLLAAGLPTLLNGRRKSPDASATFAHLVQSISGIIHVKWTAERRLPGSATYITPATALVIGDLGVLALERQWSRKVVVSIVVTGWTFVTSQSSLEAAFAPWS
ncbi:hypothetical protein JB92DRAFT_2839281 [Gautieria morchelliformis]|nr:hypothetical protein JB92DRAFT_2839281 [Gautieria morchelliformis]